MNHIRFGIFSGDNARIMFGPLWIGIERGYFSDAGADVEVIVSDHRIGAEDDPIDVEASSVGDLTRRAAAGIPVVSVVSQEQWRNGRGLTPMCARKALLDSGELTADFASLRGKRIGIEIGGSDRLGGGKMRPEPDWIIAHNALSRGGLTFADVQIVQTRHGAKAVEMLQAGEVDLINAPRPRQVVEWEDQGLLVRWKEAWEHSDRQGRSCIVRRAFAEQHPEAVQGFVTGWIRASRDYVNAISEGQGREEMLDLLVRHSGEERRVAERMSPLGVNPDGTVDVESMQRDADLWASNGLIDRAPPMATVVDNSFVDRALRELGPYAPPAR